jgi:hypothetical protein
MAVLDTHKATASRFHIHFHKAKPQINRTNSTPLVLIVLKTTHRNMSWRESNNASLVIEQLGVMLSQEKTYKCYDYLNSIESAVCAADRQALCVWGYSIIAACTGVDKSVAAVAVSYFDRYLSVPKSSTKEAVQDTTQLQLAFVSCLTLALKARAGMSVEMCFVSDVICDGYYNAEEIIEMEFEIIKTLKWHLNGPTPHDFIDAFLQFAGPSIESRQRDIVSRYSKHIAEVGLLNYFIGLHFPSSIAYASIWCALQLIGSISPMDGLHILQRLKAITDANSGFELQPLLGPLLCMTQEHSPDGVVSDQEM